MLDCELDERMVYMSYALARSNQHKASDLCFFLASERKAASLLWWLCTPWCCWHEGLLEVKVEFHLSSCKLTNGFSWW